AASFEHVPPAGAAVSGPVEAVAAEPYGLGRVGDLTSAHLRARDADPRSSYGDFVAVSHPVDAELPRPARPGAAVRDLLLGLVVLRCRIGRAAGGRSSSSSR
ncbi:hypothetical protein, partial [Actinoallomurus acaciae]